MKRGRPRIIEGKAVRLTGLVSEEQAEAFKRWAAERGGVSAGMRSFCDFLLERERQA